jgi:hypothetical protein
MEDSAMLRHQEEYMTFDTFKAGPPRSIMSALGPDFLQTLEMAPSYKFFRKAILTLNDAHRGCFVQAAKRYGRVCSPGERELLKGILLLCDFAHVADEISAGETYGNMTRCGGDFRYAFAACIINAGY